MTRRHLLILALFAVLLILPAFLFGAGGFEALVECMTVRLFAAQFWHGDLYPRWIQDLYAGNGSPLFFYYPPLAYFITSLFIFLAPLDPFGYYPIAASVGVAAFIAGVSFYLWMKDEGQDASAALTGSLLYMSAPDVVGWHFHYVALFPSVWGWAWLPLLMMYARRTMLRAPYARAGFALALAALIMTNIPMTIIFGPFAVAYGALYCRRDRIIRQACTLGAATLLGFALCAIFLVPAAAYLDYTNTQMMWTGKMTDYRHYFVTPGFGYLSQTVFTLVILIMAALTLAYSIALRGRPAKQLFFALASLIGLFMIMPASAWVWKLIPVLKTLQLPGRFFMVPSLCLAVLAALALPRLRLLAYALVVLYVGCTFALATLDTRVTEAGLRRGDHFKYERYVLNIEFGGFLTSPDLLAQYFAPEKLAALDRPHNRAETVSGNAAAEVTKWKPRDIALHYKAAEPSLLRIWQFYFPGTVATHGGENLPVARDRQTGQILVEVPPGEGDVEVKLTQLPPEIAGKMISLLSAGILLLGFLIELRSSAREDSRDA